MKSNLFFIGLGVLCTILFCISSTNARNVRYFEAKYKREVDPLPETKADINDRQSEEKEEEVKVADNIPAAQSTTEEMETKRIAEVEPSQKSFDNFANIPDSSTNLETKPPAPVAQIDNEPAVETAQAANKEEVDVKHTASGEDEKDVVPDLKPAASNVEATAVNPTTSHSASRKSYRPFWTRASAI